MHMEEQEKLLQKYNEKVVKEVRIRLGIPSKEAQRLLEESPYIDLIDNDPELVMHYPPRYWVDKLLNSQFILA
ncbi:hypothetical protein RCG17_06645 [Neobacillus sp. PS3-12]|uniref:hypothetical protein n=1 Tax=Neobacillus sp. PS3-12 TaxID=3070677 RepID=UPI0027E0FCBD|nr:hypothetical protein [Neobacillus sp. PS3-12]WML54320.1 hypothetical protein RCG17_06645 [Neobacillus sp. PS3-12]